MTMHHEVKVTYEALLHEKELRIEALTQALAQSRRGLWGRLLGRGSPRQNPIRNSPLHSAHPKTIGRCHLPHFGDRRFCQ